VAVTETSSQAEKQWLARADGGQCAGQREQRKASTLRDTTIKVFLRVNC
jgi:hypothetical protein